MGYLSPNVPRLPPKFLPRSEDLRTLKEKVAGADQQPVAVTGTRRGVSIQGMGGIGKSVLAAAIARDDDVRQAFPDGVFWVSLGQEPNVLSLQTELAKELGEKTPDFSDVSGGKKYLKESLATRCCFVVLDDIWQEQHLRSFDVLGDRCQMLITTRDSSLVTGFGAVEHSLELLSQQQARQLLADWTGCELDDLPPQADEIARECGYLPLALSMAGAMLKKNRRWDSVLQRLQRADLAKIRQQFPDYDYPDLLKMLQVSVDALEPELQERYLDFAVFSEDARIPQVVLETFWAPHGLDDLDVGDMVDELVAKSLLRRDDQENLFLHDLQYDYIGKQVEDLPALHQRWLDAYKEKCEQGWASCPQDGYFFGQLTRHLKEAGQLDELRQLLFDYDWLRAQLTANGINTLLADYDWLTDDKALKLLQSTLRLSSHVLATKPQQLNQRLWGHLRDREQPEFSSLLTQGATQQPSVWLRPQRGNLTAPDGPMIRTLEGHSSLVNSVVLSDDGTRALSGSYDTTLKLWDLTTGETIRTLECHSSRVTSVVLSDDGTRALSGSDDTTLKLWDLTTGETIRTLEGHSSIVTSVVMSDDGTRALSGSYDTTLKLWDLTTGETIRTLEGHSSFVTSVVLSDDGTRALSGSDDKTLKLWDLTTGETIRTLEGHSSIVTSVVLSDDGTRALSGSYDTTLKLWDLTTGETIRTLEGHSSLVNSVVLSDDGTRALSGSSDTTLKLWDLTTGETIRTLEGHSSRVTSVVLSDDGTRALSGSYDTTLKLWDLTTGETIRTLEGHSSLVNSVVLSDDGTRALSGSSDTTLKLWDLTTGETIRTLEGHSSRVTSVVLSDDGTRALSGSYDTTLKLWDLTTGETIRTLEGHSS
ncbi:MAG: hypothetical protein F6K11_09505, partial [Leptolyngbya sp. SIO3F4]|nr:hypothetical protein [Leptolyngbya sp. SIO3F4]